MSSPADPLRLVGRAAGAIRRRVLVHRRLLAALCAGTATLLALQILRPAAEPHVEVWTASHDLAGGAVLAPADLRRTAYLPASVPDGAVTDPAPLYGRYLAAPLRRGEPLTDVAVVAPPLNHADPSRTAVPVRISDAGLVALLRVGDRVDLVAVDPDRRGDPRVVATGARVIALPQIAGGSRDGSGPSGRLVVFAVYPTEAAPVVAAATSGALTITLSG